MIDLVRVSGWRRALNAEIERLRRSPFAWGAHDCGPALAGGVVLALTGVDVAAPWRGRYDSAKGALDVLAADGFATLGDLVASLLPEYDHVSRARVGDLVAYAVPSPLGHALGVVVGERAMVMTETGLGTLNYLAAARGYRVG